MSDFTNALEHHNSEKVWTCKLGHLLDDPEIGAELAEAVAAGVTGAAITRALNDVGRVISLATVHRHTSGACGCG